MRISDWSSDVCSSDLPDTVLAKIAQVENAMSTEDIATALIEGGAKEIANASHILADCAGTVVTLQSTSPSSPKSGAIYMLEDRKSTPSELQSLMRISYAVFCLKKKKKPNQSTKHYT